MKQLVVLVLALFTATGFSQDMGRERRGHDQKEKRETREKISPEKRSEIQTKRMTLTLDLSEQQQLQVKSALLDHFLEGQKRMDANKKSKKDFTEDERYALMSNRLDAQIALKQKMKEILNDEQYAKYSEMMERRIKKSATRGKRVKKRN